MYGAQQGVVAPSDGSSLFCQQSLTDNLAACVAADGNLGARRRFGDGRFPHEDAPGVVALL
jgi:hypothetical protein